MWISRLSLGYFAQSREASGKVLSQEMWHVPLTFIPLKKSPLLSTNRQWTPWRLWIRNIWGWPGRSGGKRVAPVVSVDLGQVSHLGQRLSLSLQPRELPCPTWIFPGYSSTVTFGAQKKLLEWQCSSGDEKEPRGDRRGHAIECGSVRLLVVFLTLFKRQKP